MISDNWGPITVDFSNVPDPIDQFLDAVFGEGVGYVAVSFGRVPTTPTFYPWPTGKGRLLADVERRKARDNVFFCPALRANEGALKLPENCAEGETPSLPVEPMPCLWADVDLIAKDGTPKEVNVALLNALGGIHVRSGTGVNEHWYGPLTAGVGLTEFSRLNTSVKNALGADAKQSNVSWLRWPTSINHKPTARRRVWLPEDMHEVTVALDDVEALVASHARRTTPTKRRQGARKPARHGASEAGIRRLLRRRYAHASEGELSEAFHHAVVEAAEDGVSIDRIEELLTGHVVAARFEREGRLRHEIERSARKAAPRPTADTRQRDRTSWTLDELMRQEFPELTWAVDGLVPEGLTLLVAAPKIGKSFLTMCLALSLSFGHKALGSLDGDAGEVLVIPLDDPSPRRMQTRLREIMEAAGLNPRDQRFELHLETDWPTLAEGGGEQLDEWLENHPSCSLVVIDTLSRLRDEDARRSSDPGKPDEKAMAEFKRIADKHRVAIIGTHHDKKGEDDDFLDMVSGNKKLTGGADTIVYLKRARNQGHAVAKITGRDVEEREMALDFQYPLWLVSDRSPAELDMSDIRLQIIDYLRDHGEASIKHVAAGLDMPYQRVQQRMFQMKNAGEIEQEAPRQPYRLPRT